MAASYYPAPRETISLKIDEHLDHWLANEARRLGRTKSDIAREALEQKRNGGGRRSLHDLMQDVCSLTKGGPKDYASNRKYLKGFGRRSRTCWTRVHCWPTHRLMSNIMLRRANAELLWAFLRRGALRIAFDLKTEFESVAVLMKRYADVPMELADACLVRMSELRRECRIWTLDRDFEIYRRFGRQVIPLICPL